jgi:hypothetical protein
VNPNDIVFDENYSMSGIFITQQNEDIRLSISDGLDAAHEPLQDDYKNRIANFINFSKSWFPIALNKIKTETENPGELQLICIHILFEQNQDNSLFGLEFYVDFDMEHGRGMVINGESLEIVGYGDADVSIFGA